jgi:hypothetical protein
MVPTLASRRPISIALIRLPPVKSTPTRARPLTGRGWGRIVLRPALSVHPQ